MFAFYCIAGVACAILGGMSDSLCLCVLASGLLIASAIAGIDYTLSNKDFHKK